MWTAFKDPQGQALYLLGYGEVEQCQQLWANLSFTILPPLSVLCLRNFSVYFSLMARTRYAGITRETYFIVGKDRPMQYRSEAQK